MNNKRILESLKWMIESDDTNIYQDTFNENGTINQDGLNAYWFNGLAQAQLAYYEATGDVIRSGNGFVAPELEHLVKRDDGEFSLTLHLS